MDFHFDQRFSIFTGALTFWLSIPIGIALILLGTTLLVRHSPDARRWARYCPIPFLD